MRTVADLIAALAALPAATSVNTVIIERCGHYADHHCGAVAGVDVSLDDDGRITGVWITATPTREGAPAVVAINCDCGQRITVDDTNPWPEPHRWCNHPAAPHTPPPSS